MDTVMYYFSGTGNTLAVAREIAQITNAKLIPVQQAMHQDRITVGAHNVGIVFPSYIAIVSGVPLIVERFIRKIENINTLRIFTVCTCGGYEIVNALPSLHTLSRIIRSCGGKVSAAYSVRLPMNNLDYDHIPVPIERDSGVVIQQSRKKIESICNRIQDNKGTQYRALKALFLLFINPFYKLMKKPIINSLRQIAKEPSDSKLTYSELIPLTDRSIAVDESCTGCGLCAKICPVQNISIMDGKPTFSHKCEMCFACDEWCPSGAIHHWSRKPGIKYRHPDIQLSDMLIRE